MYIRQLPISSFPYNSCYGGFSLNTFLLWGAKAVQNKINIAKKG